MAKKQDQHMPDWLPPVLYRQYEMFLSSGRSLYAGHVDDQTFARVLEAFVTDARMKLVWEELNRLSIDPRSVVRFFPSCLRAFGKIDRAPKLSRSKKRDELQRIARNAYALAQSLRDLEEWMPSQLSQLYGKELTKFGEGLSDWDEPEYFVSNLDEVVPTFPQILWDIAAFAENEADLAPLALKPNSESARLHVFVRTLNRFMIQEFSRPLHELVATTTTVVFEREVDADLVRKLVSKEDS